VSTQYNPNGTLPQATAPAPVAIASSTNTSPIEIATTTPHGYTEGDTVQVIGHDQLAANGDWVIALTGASSFTLTGSVGTGAGGATGQVQDFSVNPLLTLPADGDLRYAASVNVPISGQANVAPWLYKRVGKYATHDVYASDDFLAVGNVYSATALPTATWTTLTGLGMLFSSQADRYLATGDQLDIVLSTSISVGASEEFGLAVGIAYNGGAFNPISGTVRSASNANAAAVVFPISCSVLLSTGFSANDRFDLAVMGYLPTVGPVTINVMTGYSLVCCHLRSNA
jgi:hypothetical protein